MFPTVALFLVAAGWEVKVKQSYQVMKQEDKKMVKEDGERHSRVHATYSLGTAQKCKAVRVAEYIL